MRIFYIALVVIISSSVVFTQSINVTVNNLETSAASFSYLDGEKTFHLDSLNSYGNGKFTISTNNYKLHNGFYRVFTVPSGFVPVFFRY